MGRVLIFSEKRVSLREMARTRGAVSHCLLPGPKHFGMKFHDFAEMRAEV
jgi:hypothetical protein